MKKMLYFDGVSAARVHADGPSLLVRSKGRGPQRYPLRYLYGVEVRGEGEWSVGALRALFEAGIPIVVRGRRGEVLGYAHGVFRPSSGLVARLEDASQVEGFASEYRIWRDATERRILLRTLKQMRIALSDLRRTTVVEWWEAWMRRRYGLPATLRWVESYRLQLESESSSHLLRSGYGVQFVSTGDAAVPLASDLAWMSQWQEWMGLSAACRVAGRKGDFKELEFLGELRRQRERMRETRIAFWNVLLEQLSFWLESRGI